MQEKLMDPGSVVREVVVSSLPGASPVVAGLGRARGKVRGEMSGIYISLCRGTAARATWKADLVALSEALYAQAPTATRENSPGEYPNFILSPNVSPSSNIQTGVAVHRAGFVVFFPHCLGNLKTHLFYCPVR